jgi:hypothetical protein
MHGQQNIKKKKKTLLYVLSTISLINHMGGAIFMVVKTYRAIASIAKIL